MCSPPEGTLHILAEVRRSATTTVMPWSQNICTLTQYRVNPQPSILAGSVFTQQIPTLDRGLIIKLGDGHSAHVKAKAVTTPSRQGLKIRSPRLPGPNPQR